MPIGYVLNVRDILDYYGRAEISEAICRAVKGRKSHITGAPQRLGGAEPNIPELCRPDQILSEVQKFLEEYSTDDVPRKYPAFHSVIGRDIVLEIDIKHDHNEAFAEGRKILDILDSYNLVYRVKFSGNSSPHIIIPAEAYQHLVPEDEGEEAFKKLYSFLVKECSTVGVDSSFSSSDHFLRLPYSLNENTGLISTPVKPENYDNFQLGMAEVDAVQVAEWWFDMQDFRDNEENMKSLLDQVLREGEKL